MVNFNITITSDTICPWCYIGAKSLDKAISLYQRTYPGGRNDTFTFTWRAYYLDASAPEKGVAMLERIAAKNGAERVDAICTRLKRVGAQYGIAFGLQGKIGRTRDSHRVVALAGERGLQNEVVRCLFEMLFERGGDTTARADLVDAAERVGLSRAEVESMLATEEYVEQVDGEAREAREDGVKGVPSVSIMGKVFEDALDPVEMMQKIVEARESWCE